MVTAESGRFPAEFGIFFSEASAEFGRFPQARIPAEFGTSDLPSFGENCPDIGNLIGLIIGKV
jgi:hypothetical protein